MLKRDPSAPTGGLFSILGRRGSAGLPSPELLDIGRLPRGHSSNSALAAPAQFQPPPDIVTRDYSAGPQHVFGAVKATALSQPRTVLHREFADALQAHFVARSAILGFPDLVVLQVLSGGNKGSQVVIWSRSVYGRYDFGVNRKRLVAWLSAIDAALPNRNDP